MDRHVRRSASKRARDSGPHPSALATDSVVAALCARRDRGLRRPGPTRRLERRRERYAGSGRAVERAGLLAARGRAHGIGADRQGARVRRLDRRNLCCAGHVELADGRTLIVGGNIAADDGLADTTIFNPTTNTYFRAPDMSVGRWYPTATELPDGRVLTFAGDNIVQDRPGQPHPFEDASVNSLPSIFNPTTNTWTDLTAAKLTSPLYPFMFVLSDGRVFNAGPDTTTRILDPGNQTWTTVGTSPIDGMSAVMYRPNKVMKAGTWADPDFEIG